jgi:ferrous iron transport protein A
MDNAHETPSSKKTPSTPNRNIWLGNLPTGARATVCRLCGGREFAARAAALGFTPGAEVTVLQNYGHGPVIVLVRGSRVALGRGEAQKIQVEI